MVTGGWNVSPLAGRVGRTRTRYVSDSFLGNDILEGVATINEEEDPDDPRSPYFYEVDAWEEDIRNCKESQPVYSQLLDPRDMAGGAFEAAKEEFLFKLKGMLKVLEDRTMSVPFLVYEALVTTIYNISKRADRFTNDMVPKIINIEKHRALELIYSHGDIDLNLFKPVIDSFDTSLNLFYHYFVERHTNAFLKVSKKYVKLLSLEFNEAVNLFNTFPRIPTHPKSYFDGLTMCAFSLKQDLDNLLEVSTPDDISFSVIWKLLLRYCDVVCEIMYKALGHCTSRVAADLGVTRIKSTWDDWSNVERLINAYLDLPNVEPSNKNLRARSYLTTSVSPPAKSAPKKSIPGTPEPVLRRQWRSKVKPPFLGAPGPRGLSIVRQSIRPKAHSPSRERELMEQTCPRPRLRRHEWVPPQTYRRVAEQGIHATVLEGPTNIDKLPFLTGKEVNDIMQFYDILYSDLRDAVQLHRRNKRKAHRPSHHLQRLTEILAEAENLYESSMSSLLRAIQAGALPCCRELPRQRKLILDIHKLIKKYFVNSGKNIQTLLEELVFKRELVPAEELLEDFTRERKQAIPFTLEYDEADAERDLDYFRRQLEIQKGHLASLKDSIINTETGLLEVFKPLPVVLENLLSSWKTDVLRYVEDELQGLEAKLKRNQDWRDRGFDLNPSPSLMEQKKSLEDRLYNSLHSFLHTCVGKVMEQLTPVVSRYPEIRLPLIHLRKRLAAFKNSTLEIRNGLREMWESLLDLHKTVKRVMCRNTFALTKLEEYLGVTLVGPEDMNVPRASRVSAAHAVESSLVPAARRRTLASERRLAPAAEGGMPLPAARVGPPVYRRVKHGREKARRRRAFIKSLNLPPSPYVDELFSSDESLVPSSVGEDMEIEHTPPEVSENIGGVPEERPIEDEDEDGSFEGSPVAYEDEDGSFEESSIVYEVADGSFVAKRAAPDRYNIVQHM